MTSVTSETSWGQTMSFSDLTEVSNFSWRCQLSYEVLFVELGWKLKHPDRYLSVAHFDPPASLTDKKPASFMVKGLINWANLKMGAQNLRDIFDFLETRHKEFVRQTSFKVKRISFCLVALWLVMSNNRPETILFFFQVLMQLRYILYNF